LLPTLNTVSIDVAVASQLGNGYRKRGIVDQPYPLALLPPLLCPLALLCSVPRLGAFSASNTFIVGALFRPALDVITCIIAGAVDGGGIKASSTACSFSSSSSSPWRAWKDRRGGVSVVVLLTAGRVLEILLRGDVKGGEEGGRGEGG
jgi:hypothetical protein